MGIKIRSLTIDRFRAFRHIEINGLGRVSLITGRNNTGKSSVLEALRILASEASPSVINEILGFREERSSDTDLPSRTLRPEDRFAWSNLFNGFPDFSANIEPIEIVSNGSDRPMRVSMAAALYSVEVDSDGNKRRVELQGDLFDEEEALPALNITAGNTHRMLPLPSLGRRSYPPWSFRSESGEEAKAPCMFVSPYGGEQTTVLAPLWDKIALSDSEKEVVEALRIIDPEISAVSMVGAEGPRGARTAIVRAKDVPRPVPLRSFGDGLNRLFGIVLSLVNAKGGLLLIDEFENGMHHTVQTDTWRAIFRLASRLDVQVVATSHSWDAIEAFQRAACEDPEEGVLIRLSRKGEDIIPTLFSEDELLVATREGIEVR